MTAPWCRCRLGPSSTRRLRIARRLSTNSWHRWPSSAPRTASKPWLRWIQPRWSANWTWSFRPRRTRKSDFWPKRRKHWKLPTARRRLTSVPRSSTATNVAGNCTTRCWSIRVRSSSAASGEAVRWKTTGGGPPKIMLPSPLERRSWAVSRRVLRSP